MDILTAVCVFDIKEGELIAELGSRVRAAERAFLLCVIQRDSAYPAFTYIMLIDNEL